MAEEQITINTDQESELAVITRLQKTTSKEVEGGDLEQVTYYAPFGATDNNVQMYYDISSSEEEDWRKWGSLRDFFAEWLNFKKIWKNFVHEATFYQYSSEEPNSNNVKIWFQIPESTDEGEPND